MKLSKLTLKQFRNLEPLTLLPHENLNLIVGMNASGKTNLCEALYYASRGSLLKGERQRELIHWNCTWCTLTLDVGQDRIRIVLDGETSGKTIELSDEPVNQRTVFGVFKVLIFTPDDLQILKGSPSKRRRLLDRSVADLDARYHKEFLAYEHVLRRKNLLLRRERVDEDLLSVYNQQLVQHGSQLLEKRWAYLQDLNQHLKRVHTGLNLEQSSLELRYESDVDYQRDTLAQQLEAALLQARSEERERRMGLIGPHRDDLRFDLEGVDLRKYGSQGQQKTALIALKLAQLELFHDALGEYPVLVLDDVLSELDPQRTQLLLDHLPQDLQLFLTETALSEALVQRAGKIFRVVQGCVQELSKEEACA